MSCLMIIVDILVLRLEVASTISGTMKWVKVVCRHRRYHQFLFKQRQHLQLLSGSANTFSYPYFHSFGGHTSFLG